MPSLSASSRALSALLSWKTVIGLLMVENISHQSRSSSIGVLLTFFEPFFVVITFILLRDIAMSSQGRMSGAYGQSLFVFLSSGILPFYLFVRMALRSRRSHNTVSNRLPRTSHIDVVIASTLAGVSLYLITMLAWFAGLYFAGCTEAAPRSVADCIYSLFFLAMLGVGFGLTNSALVKVFPIWDLPSRIVFHGLIFISGILHMASYMPLATRNILIWNPISHAVEWFRVGLYGTYPTMTLDREYLVECAAAALLVGILAYRSTMSKK